MPDAPRPPLPDIDWTEAVEKAEDVLRRYGLEPDSVLGSAACDVVRAAWPILHAAAQPLPDLCAPLPRRAEQGGGHD